MDYSDMKATQSSKKESLTEALSDIADELQKNTGNSGSKGKRSSTSKSKSAKSSTKSGSTSKSSNSKNSSTNKSSGSKNASSSKSSGVSKNTSASSNKTTSKNTTKTSATKNSSSTSTPKSSYKSSSSTKKKNTPPPKPPLKVNLCFIFGISFLAISLVLGFFLGHFLLKNDVYEMIPYANGEIDVVIGSQDSENEGQIQYYQELGVKCVAFGKDFSDKCSVKYYYRNDLTQDEVEVEFVDPTVAGMYYAVYTSASKKYSTVKLIRNIIVLRGEENE